MELSARRKIEDLEKAMIERLVRIETAIDILMEDYFYCSYCEVWFKKDDADENIKYHYEQKHF